MTRSSRDMQPHTDSYSGMLRSLWEGLPQGLVLLSHDGVVMNVNPALCRLLEHSPAKLLGIAFHTLLESTDKTRFDIAFDSMLAGHSSALALEVTLPGVAPSRRSVRLHGWRIDADRSAGVVVQIEPTKPCAAEISRLQRSEQRLDALHKADSLLIWMIDVEQHFCFLNRGWQEFSGQHIDDFIGRHWEIGIHPDDLDSCRNTLMRACQMHQAYTLEYRRRRFDGEYRWLRETAIPYFAGGDHFLGLVGTAINIEEIKHSQTQQRLNEHRYRAIMATSTDGFLFFDPQRGMILEVNDALCAITGYSKHQFFGKRLDSLFVTEKRTTLSQLFDQPVVADHRKLELRLITQSGEERIVAFNATRLRDIDGVDVGAFAFITDIHERKLAEIELQRAAMVFDTCNEGIVITDCANRIISVNPAFTAITGYQLDEIRGQTPAILGSGRQDESFYTTLWEQLYANGHWRGELWNRRKNGDVYAEWLSISVVRDSEGRPVQHLAIFSDVTERKMVEETLRYEADYDALTDLLNRRGFLHGLNHMLNLAELHNEPLALLFVDLDRFKWVNDTLGHAVGDKLLVEIAERLRHTLRASDLIGRLGGDEFVILIPHNLGDIEKIADKVLKRLAERFQIGEHEFAISGSIGIVLYPEHARDAGGLMRHADAAMYQAKQAGRGCYRIFHHGNVQ